MIKYLAFFILPFIMAFTSNNPEINKTNRYVQYDETRMVEAAHTIDEPYDLSFQIEGSENGEYRLVTTINLYNGSYFGSPLSNNNFTGLFTISIEDNRNLTMDDAIEETPKSVETIDEQENVPINLVEVNTTYKRNLNIEGQNDFDVMGKITFTIEPRCTFEEIPFIIKYRSGVLRIERWGC